MLCAVFCLQLTAARLVIDHTVQQVTGHEGQGDKPQVWRAEQQQHSLELQLEKALLLEVPMAWLGSVHAHAVNLSCLTTARRVTYCCCCCHWWWCGGGGVCPQMQVVCQGQATVVFLDDTYRPVRVPAKVKAALAHLHQEYKAGLTGS